MPGRNGTGPVGAGAGTGRGMGPCGRGQGFNRGAETGFRRGAGANVNLENMPPEDELVIRETQVKRLKRQLKEVEGRISELKDN